VIKISPLITKAAIILGALLFIAIIYLLVRTTPEKYYKKAETHHKKGEKKYSKGKFESSEVSYKKAEDYRKRARELQ